MGQDLKAVQQSIISLETNNSISPRQAQAFLKDYHDQSQSLEDVRKFHEAPHLPTFLKYRDGAQAGSLRGTVCSRMSYGWAEEDEDLNILVRVIEQYNLLKEKIGAACQAISQASLGGEHYLQQQRVKRLIASILGIQDLQITERRNQIIHFHHWDIDFTQIFTPGEPNFQNFENLLNKNGDSLSFDANTKIYSLRCVYEDRTQFSCTFKQCQGQFIFPKVSGSQSQVERFGEVFGCLLENFVNNSQRISRSKKLSLFSKNVLNALAIFVDAGVKSIREELEVLAENDFPSAISTLKICQYLAQKFEFKGQKAKKLFERLIKKEQELCKLQEFIKIYQSNIGQRQMILELDRYGKIKFCYGADDQQIIRKIKDYWNPEANKPIQLFKQYKKLTTNIKKAMEGNLAPGITSIEQRQFLANIYICDEGKLDRIHFLHSKSGRSEQNFDMVIQKQNESLDKQQTKENYEKEQENKKLKDKQQVKPKQPQSWVKLFNKTSKKQRGLKDKTRIHNCLGNSKILSSSSIWNEQPLKNMQSCDLDILMLKDRDLQKAALSILRENPLFNLLVCQPESCANFQRFIAQLRFHYNVNKNFFHNFHHAVNVMHTSYLILLETKNDLFLSDLQKLCVVFSGLCHDVGHTGFNNAFEIATFSTKAMNYNDISPLENYHACKTFEILRTQDKNFLGKMEPSMMTVFKKNVVYNILSTDMQHHFPLLQEFRAWRNLPKQEAVDSISTLTALIVHSSDFAGAAKDFPISQQWSRRVNSEFARQYEKQFQLGLPQTPMFAGVQQMEKWARNQGGFLRGIVIPLYKELECFYGSENCWVGRLSRQLEQNQQQWQKLEQEYQQK